MAVKQCHAECNAHSAATSSHDQTVVFLLPFMWPNSHTSMATLLLECHFQVSATAVQPDSARRELVDLKDFNLINPISNHYFLLYNLFFLCRAEPHGVIRLICQNSISLTSLHFTENYPHKTLATCSKFKFLIVVSLEERNKLATWDSDARKLLGKYAAT